jgi:hypothetical protein
MDLEESQRRHMEDLKREERVAAEKEVYEALAKFQSAPPTALPPSSSAGASPSTATHAAPSTTAAASTPATAGPPRPPGPADAARGSDESKGSAASSTQIWSGTDSSSDFAHAAAAEEEEEEEAVYIPPPRSCRAAVLAFTPRTFPTPMRESTAREEEDWLARNRYKARPALPCGLCVRRAFVYAVVVDVPASVTCR